jgi:hypothetical protein
LEQGDGLAFEDEEVKEPRLFPTGLEPPSYSDPLIEQFNIFWDAFESSSYEEKWSLVADKLHESPEMFDAETVFEVGNALFSEAAQAGDIDRFNQLLDTFQDRVPDAYAYELGYVLEWRTFGALISGNTAAVEKYFHEFTPIAGQELDTYYRLLRALAYHGELSILLDGMRQARPFVEEYPALVEWAYSEFSELLGTYELLHLLDKNPELAADDPTLLERFEEYELTI